MDRSMKSILKDILYNILKLLLIAALLWIKETITRKEVFFLNLRAPVAPG